MSKLLKGFVRSAVNQVGRDSGKVISNQVFGDAHATPIRIVKDQNQVMSNNPNEPHFLSDVQVTKEYIWVKWIWAVLISILIPFIGAFLILYRSIINFFKKTQKVDKLTTSPVYKSDKRYKEGVRYSGVTTVKNEIKIEPLPGYLKKQRIKAVGYLVIALIGFYFWSDFKFTF